MSETMRPTYYEFMKPHELFGIGLRWIALAIIMIQLPSLFSRTSDYATAFQLIAALLLFTRADVLARACYPNPKSLKDPEDFGKY